MNEIKAIEFIENSFLNKLLFEENITDISYNGENIFYHDNRYGRLKSDLEITQDCVMDFLRQISNLGEKRFSIQEPILDLSIGKYRINATHPYLSRKNHLKVPTFSLRIASEKLLIANDRVFMPLKVEKLIKNIIDNKMSIVIGGKTGTGKTELQKYLLTLMSDATRVLVIDNVLELDSLLIKKDIDLTMWQYDNNKNELSISSLVRNALRYNPDWLIVAESRGEEMLDVLNSALTGHPIITTIHALSVNTMLSRIVSMVMKADKRPTFKDVRFDVFTHLRVFIFTTKEEVDGITSRYISNIMLLGPTNSSTIVYSSDGKHSTYHEINDALKQDFKLDSELIKDWR